MIKVLSIFGTRPEAIKMAPVVKELEKFPDQYDSVVCVTAQHREMLDQVLNLFEIKPDHDLDLMRKGQTLSGLTSRVFAALDPVFEAERPDWVLVQGDTTTVMAASLAKWQPFPEEINRQIAGVVADLHFAPTESARQNLLAEGVDPETVHVTGNTVIDALLMAAKMPFDLENSPLSGIPWEKKILLVTAHRRENFGKPLEDICAALVALASMHPDVHLVYPVHPNPEVKRIVYPALGEVENSTLLDPLDYLPLVQLMKRSYLVLTDSGGIQEEAPGLGKPVLVLREKTERPEGVVAGGVLVVGTNTEHIVEKASTLLSNQALYAEMSKNQNPYGDGRAAEIIVNKLMI